MRTLTKIVLFASSFGVGTFVMYRWFEHLQTIGGVNHENGSVSPELPRWDE